MKKILVVDDNILMRKLIINLFHKDNLTFDEAGDGAEGRLPGHLSVEQLVGFFHHDHQLAWLSATLGAELVGLSFPGLPDAACEQVAHQQVIQV